MRAWSFVCVRMHTGVGGRHIDSESTQCFGLGKTIIIVSCAPDGVWRSSPTLYQLSHPVTPIGKVAWASGSRGCEFKSPVRAATFIPRPDRASGWWVQCLVLRIRQQQNRGPVCYRCACVTQPMATEEMLPWLNSVKIKNKKIKIHKCQKLLKASWVARLCLSWLS